MSGQITMSLEKLLHRSRAVSLPVWLAIGVSVLGLVLRIEHAATFDGPNRGADYGAHLEAVKWMMTHWKPFFMSPEVNGQTRFYPPLWYALAGILLRMGGPERAIASLAVIGWVIRHTVLAKMLHEAAPGRRWSALAALSIHALLPLSVLIDGKVNPEGLHSGFFMVALYCLWRMERQCRKPDYAISIRTAIGFGLFTGLAILTKATAGILLLAGVMFLVWFSVRGLYHCGWKKTWNNVLRPAVFAAAAWCVVAGGWCGPNLVKFGHPFPHAWDVERPVEYAELAQPVLYRRPLGWSLPFEWQEYWRFPILRSLSEPRPNFWAVEIVGTWSDFYNRGFCRLKSRERIDRVWGAKGGLMVMGPDWWNVNDRCVGVFVQLVHVGVWLSLAATLATFYMMWLSLRTKQQQGSLTLPVVILLSMFTAWLFALVYPLDNIAVLNPRYLLSQVTPMAACLGFAMADLEAATEQKNARGAVSSLAINATLILIAVVGALLIFERLGS